MNVHAKEDERSYNISQKSPKENFTEGRNRKNRRNEKPYTALLVNRLAGGDSQQLEPSRRSRELPVRRLPRALMGGELEDFCRAPQRCWDRDDGHLCRSRLASRHISSFSGDKARIHHAICPSEKGVSTQA